MENEEEIIIKDLSLKRDVFTIYNPFNNAKIDLSPLAFDLFLLLVAHIAKEDSVLYCYRTSQSEIQKIFNKRIKKESIEAAADELLSRVCEFKIEERIISTPLFSKFKYDGGNIELKLDDKLIEIVLKKDNKFTIASFNELILIKSIYAKRLYLLFKQFSSKREYVMHLEHIYKVLNLEGKYERYSHFKSRILNPAINNINEKTSLSISFFEFTKNRTVQRIKFEISSTEKEKKEKSSKVDNLTQWLNSKNLEETQSDDKKSLEVKSASNALEEWMAQQNLENEKFDNLNNQAIDS